MTRKIGLVLSGWAPAMTLMSGAMLGFIEKGVEFEVISTAGVGALIGLLALAPKSGDRVAALKELPNLFVSDLIYSFLPINFKVFHKLGPFSRPMAELRRRIPKFPLDPKDRNHVGRLVNDWVDLMFCAMTPSTFELKSQGLMSPGPEIEGLVDFDKLKQASTKFYVNAFDLNKKTLEIFDNNSTDVDVYNAAQALAVLFPPPRMRGGDLMTTGATHDPTGLQAIWLNQQSQLDMVVMLDPLSRAIWRASTNIHDAFQLMLMNPIAALQVIIAALYARTDHAAEQQRGEGNKVDLPPLYRVPLPVPEKYYPAMLKWSHSNAVTLEKIGYDAAVAFADAMKNEREFEQKYRYYNEVEKNDRLQRFSRLFAPMFERGAATALAGSPPTPPATAPTPAAPARAAPAGQAPPDPPKNPSAAAAPTPAGWWEAPSGMGVLASGGAPNLHLVSGALCAFYENKISFDVIGASGAGALPGLLYAAPKKPESQVAALQQTVNMNVSDAIYQLLPMNYKAFFKRGPFAEPLWRFGQSIPHRKLDPAQQRYDTFDRLFNDSIDFMVAALTPSTLNYFSKSVCTRVGVIDDWIDWQALKTYKKDFYLNAFDLNTQKLKLFGNKDLTPETFWAALAMPWLFEPTAANGDLYTEGASHDPSGLEALWEFADQNTDKLDRIIALDTVGPDLWTNPANIYDALQLAIMDPIVSLAETVLAAYGRVEYAVNQSGLARLPKLYHVPFPVPDWEAPHILEWTYSNALTLWNVGHKAGAEFVKALDHPAELEKYRYYNSKKGGAARTTDFLKLFDNVLPSRGR